MKKKIDRTTTNDELPRYYNHISNVEVVNNKKSSTNMIFIYIYITKKNYKEKE